MLKKVLQLLCSLFVPKRAVNGGVVYMVRGLLS